ncbi:dnaJ homolog subfamily C member 2-like, partial [Saccoglossus kowalevskii]
MKKEKKMFRDTCKKYNYFTTDDAEALKQMQEIEKLCEKLNLTSLQELNQALKSGSEEEAKQAYHSKVRSYLEMSNTTVMQDIHYVQLPTIDS